MSFVLENANANVVPIPVAISQFCSAAFVLAGSNAGKPELKRSREIQSGAVVLFLFRRFDNSLTVELMVEI